MRSRLILPLFVSSVLVTAGAALAQLPPGLGAPPARPARPAVVATPSPAQGAFQRAVEAAQKGKLDQAIAGFKEVLKLEPKNVAARANLGMIYFQKGDAANAEKNLKVVISSGAATAPVYGLLGTIYMQTGRPGPAVPLLQKAAKADPKSYSLQASLGIASAMAGKLPEAERAYRAAIKLNGNDLRMQIALAQVLARQKKWKESRAVLKLIAAKDPKNPEVALYMATMAEQEGDAKGALDAYRHAEEIASGDPAMLFNIALSYQRVKKPLEAIRVYDKYLKSFPKEPAARRSTAFFNMGILEFGEKKFAEAVESFKMANELKKDWPEATSNLALSYAYGDKYPEAIRVFEDALKRNPNHQPLYVGLAYCYEKTRRFAEAATTYEKLIKLFPKDIEAYRKLSVVYQAVGRDSDSANVLKQAANLQPNDPSLLSELGVTYQRAGKNDLAVAAFKQAARFAPKDVSVALNLAGAYAGQTPPRAKEAIAEFERAKALAPANSEPYYRIAEILQSEKKGDEAIAELEKIKKLAKTDLGPYSQIAMIREQSGKIDAALAELNAAKKLNQTDTTPYVASARILKTAGKTDEAIAQWRELLKNDPKSTYAFSEIGRLLVEQKKYDEALAHYRKAQEIFPDDTRLAAVAGRVLANELKKPDEAIAEYRAIAKAHPKDFYILDILGTALKEQKAWQEAIDVYQQLIAVKPDHRGAPNQIALCLESMGKTDESYSRYLRNLDKNPGDGEAMNGLVRLGRTTKRLPEVVLAMKKALSGKVATMIPVDQFLDLCKELNRSKEAIDFLKIRSAKNPEDALLLQAVASAYEKDGQNDEAVKYYEKCAQADQGNFQYKFALAEAYERAGKKADAIATVKRMMEKIQLASYNGYRARQILDRLEGKKPPAPAPITPGAPKPTVPPTPTALTPPGPPSMPVMDPKPPTSAPTDQKPK